MVFASAIFIFLFLPMTMFFYWIIPKRFKNSCLFIASIIFYSWGGIVYTALVLFSITVNYFLGRRINNCGTKKRYYLIISVIFNLGILGFFKYCNFICDNISFLISLIVPNFCIDIPQIPLPIGISFFTFQIMSYIIDLYRGDIKVQNNIVNLGLYIMLFPQLIAGPIVRYIDIEKEITERKITVDSMVYGTKRFIIGLAKKVLIANAMGKWADAAFGLHSSILSTPMAWLGILGYTMQIYFDFSAYSDMAIGLGKVWGFNFLENFNYPYIACSMQDFWRRWHMSLTNWFRDYLYIPLGGNRKGKKRTYINNFIIFFCTGLWHGAAWNFIIWGLFHGMFLIIEKAGVNKIIKNLPTIIQHFYTLIIVCIGWVFFRANNLTHSFEYIKRMFIWNINGNIRFWYQLENWNILIGIIAIILCAPVFPVLCSKIKKKVGSSYSLFFCCISNICYLTLYGLSVCFIAGSSFNPFIYFRF